MRDLHLAWSWSPGTNLRRDFRTQQGVDDERGSKQGTIVGLSDIVGWLHVLTDDFAANQWCDDPVVSCLLFPYWFDSMAWIHRLMWNPTPRRGYGKYTIGEQRN